MQDLDIGVANGESRCGDAGSRRKRPGIQELEKTEGGECAHGPQARRTNVRGKETLGLAETQGHRLAKTRVGEVGTGCEGGGNEANL